MQLFVTQVGDGGTPSIKLRAKSNQHTHIRRMSFNEVHKKFGGNPYCQRRCNRMDQKIRRAAMWPREGRQLKP